MQLVASYIMSQYRTYQTCVSNMLYTHGILADMHMLEPFGHMFMFKLTQLLEQVLAHFHMQNI